MTTTPEALQEEADAVAVEIEAAVSEVAQVEASIEDGADVPFDRVPKLEHRLRLLRTRLRGLGRRRDEASSDRRLGELQQLRADIEGQIDDAQHITDLGAALYEAMVVWVAALEEHNVRHDRWVDQLRALGVPPGGGPEPSPDHGGCGLSGSEIAVGRRRINRLHVVGAAGIVADTVEKVATGWVSDEAPVFASAGAYEVPDYTPDTRFFRNEAGALHSFNAEFIARSPHAVSNLEEMSRTEFVEEQWRQSAR